MKHSFIDKYSELNSLMHKLDPRVKLIMVFLGIVAMVSETPGNIYPFVFYGAVILTLILLSRIPPGFVLKRLFFVSPFIIMAALFYPASLMLAGEYKFVNPQAEAINIGLSIFLKAGMSIILLIWLISTEKFHALLHGLRKLRMPRLIGIISALMYRYVFILADESLKTTRARDSRSPGKLKMNRIKVYSNQMAMIFLRSWERSKIIYDSMLSRGFTGDFKDMKELELKRNDILISVLIVLVFLSIRVFIEPGA